VPRFVILNHSEGKDIPDIRARYRYDAERKAAQLTAILKGKALAKMGRFRMSLR
jgi:hypothetical protein